MLNRWLFARHLEDDETLVRAVHKHWLIGLKALFWPTLLLAICWGVVWLNPSSRGLVIFMSFWAVVILVWWLRNFFDYFLDAWIITDQGVIDVAWHGWFHRQSTRTLYSDLQGVSYEIKGVLGTLLRYGTISTEKISTGASISLDYVKNPKHIETIILKNMETYLHSKNMKDATQIRDLLSALVAEQINLRGVKVEETDDSEDDA